MQTIKDLSGREWRLSVNCASIERVREETKVDLYEYGMHGDHEDLRKTLMFQLRADPFLLCKILYSLLHRQADEAEIDWEAFCEQFSDQALWDARKSLEIEIANFTVSPDRRDALKAAIEKVESLLEATHRYVLEKTRETIADPTIDEQHKTALAKLGAQFGRTPALPA